MKSRINCLIYLTLGAWLFIFEGCTKLTQVGNPVNTVTTEETFGTDATATSAIIGIYSQFLNNYGNGSTTFDLGMSADELLTIGGSPFFETNTLAANLGLSDPFWTSAYYAIYLANAAIEALPVSTGVTASVKKQLTGEAEFFRAFFHFYLVNLYGPVPIVTTTNYQVNDTISRSPVAAVYQQIIADLKAAQNNLASDYSVSGGQRVRVNQFGATALLARVYLYEQQWDSAEAQASAVIANSGLYSLTGLNSVFLANSSEAILQLEPPNMAPYATQEGLNFLPGDTLGDGLEYYLTSQLMASFEDSDQRRVNWVDSCNYQGSGIYYYYPFKYKVRNGQGNITEYYMVLRLAEQYLIRAEARAEQNNNLEGAISDLDTIRARAGLPDLPATLSQSQILSAVMQERKIEFLAEWGHRWLDLKRLGTTVATTTLSGDKGLTVPSSQLLYPIPASELVDDANLSQNAGY
jgi:hypothetical protein